MKSNITNVGDFLKSNGIKPSFQRIKVYEYLMNTKEHPTVDMIYRALIDEIPTLSKTTVYNTLNVFIENDIAHMITIDESETRYDADTSAHGHFKCEKCKQVLDFTVNIENIDGDSLNNFQINQQHIYFKGICKACLNKEESTE